MIRGLTYLVRPLSSGKLRIKSFIQKLNHNLQIKLGHYINIAYLALRFK